MVRFPTRRPCPKVASTHQPYRRSGSARRGPRWEQTSPGKQQQPVKWESAKQQQGHPQSLSEQGRSAAPAGASPLGDPETAALGGGVRPGPCLAGGESFQDCRLTQAHALTRDGPDAGATALLCPPSPRRAVTGPAPSSCSSRCRRRHVELPGPCSQGSLEVLP